MEWSGKGFVRSLTRNSPKRARTSPFFFLSIHSHTHISHGIISHSIWKTLMGARNMEGILWGICLRGLGLRWGASAAQRPLLIESITVSAAAADAGCLGVLWPPSVPLLQPLTSAWTLLCCLRQPLSTHPPSPPNPFVHPSWRSTRQDAPRHSAGHTHTCTRTQLAMVVNSRKGSLF